MQLGEFLEETGMNQSQFARWIGARPSIVSRWLEPDFEKRQIPSKKYMTIIMEKTNFRVMPNDFYPDPPIRLPVPRRQRTSDSKAAAVEYVFGPELKKSGSKR